MLKSIVVSLTLLLSATGLLASTDVENKDSQIRYISVDVSSTDPNTHFNLVLMNNTSSVARDEHRKTFVTIECDNKKPVQLRELSTSASVDVLSANTLLLKISYVSAHDRNAYVEQRDKESETCSSLDLPKKSYVERIVSVKSNESTYLEIDDLIVVIES